MDLVKVDVEGAEADVVRGGEVTLSQCRPVVFLEVHPSLLPQAEDVDLLSAYFSKADYLHLKIDQFRHSSGALASLRPVSAYRTALNCVPKNLLASHPAPRCGIFLATASPNSERF